MRLNINLASQPYEVARQYRQRMTAVIGALGLAAALLLGYIIYQRIHSRRILRQLADVQGQIDGLDREEAQARAILNKPANRWWLISRTFSTNCLPARRCPGLASLPRWSGSCRPSYTSYR